MTFDIKKLYKYEKNFYYKDINNLKKISKNGIFK